MAQVPQPIPSNLVELPPVRRKLFVRQAPQTQPTRVGQLDCQARGPSWENKMAWLLTAKAILPEHPGNRLRGPTLRQEPCTL